MARADRLTKEQRDRAVAMVAAGASIGAATRAVGTTRDNIRYHCQKAGVYTAHKPPERLITIGNRTQRLSDWSREYGIPKRTLRHRIKAGDDEDRLLRPVRTCRRPSVFEVGIRLDSWHAVLEYTQTVGCKKIAANRLGIPFGAIGAAQRGEWERLA